MIFIKKILTIIKTEMKKIYNTYNEPMQIYQLQARP